MTPRTRATRRAHLALILATCATTLTGVGVAAATPSTMASTPSTASAASAPSSASWSWHVTPTGSTEEFRGLSVVDANTVWITGEKGTVLRTVDGGQSWMDVSPPGARGLQLRDVEAFSRASAVVLSIGEGEASRIYRTSDGGRTWTEVFRNRDLAAFYDCFAFSPDGSGLAMSDPVDGSFRLIRTSDRGRSWQPFTPAQMPAAIDGEFAFAASGTCIVSRPGHRYWIATGGIETPRVFATKDGGEHWTVREVPMRGGPTAGIYSLAFRTAHQGVAVGGAFDDPTNGLDAAARTRDGGTSWTPGGDLGGYRSGVAFIPGAPRTWIAVGPTGSDVTVDDGRTWSTFDDKRFDSIQCVPRACWASGTEGRVARLVH